MKQFSINSTIRLNSGAEIPRFGLGVFRSPEGETTRQAVLHALASGYRHIDTASAYRNEKSVGEAVRESGVRREQLFITTKLWNEHHGYDDALRACERSLGRLGLDYVDLYLIHWPVPGKRLDTWKAFKRLQDEGRARAIGVSNYMVRHLEELAAHATVPPAVNQIELSPYIYQHRREVVDYCRRRSIVLEAYSPLTKGRKLADPALGRIAANYGKTPAQILIRWALQHDFVVIPKSTKPHRIEENAEVFDFDILDEDMARLDAMDEALVTGWDPTDAL